MQIILASNSPRRKKLVGEFLNKYNKTFEIEPSNICEEELKERIKEPKILVEELSYIKANDIYARHKTDERDLIIIGADTIVYFDNKILGKPKDRANSYQMLAELQGKSNDVYTGMTVIIKKNNQVNICKTHSVSKVYMKKMNEQDILEYIETGETLDKAGSYAIQGMGSKYIEKYEGDFNTAVGLDVGKLEQVLKENGVI